MTRAKTEGAFHHHHHHRGRPRRRSLPLCAALAAAGLTSPCAIAQSTAPAAPPPPEAAASAPPAAAQDAPAGQGLKLETVTVTARKREEILLEVPISMQVYSERELRNAGITDLQSLKNSAGFTFQQSGGTLAAGRSGGSLIFRGLQSSFGAQRENSGSLFVDGIFVSGGQSTVSTVGIERVEVLKGPQNTYFGRNTFGGAVNFITKNPPTTFGGEANASATARGSNDVDVTLGGPLGSDALRGSLTVMSHRKEAQYRASDGGDLGAERTTAIEGTLYATPMDKLWLRLKARAQLDDDSAPPLFTLRADVYGGSCAGRTFSGRTTAGAPITYTPTVPYFCGSVPSLDQARGVIDANTVVPPAARGAFYDNALGDGIVGESPSLSHSGMRRESRRASLQGGYELPRDANLDFSIGYNESKTRSILDLDRSGVPNFYNVNAILTDDLTLDARLSTDATQRLRGLFGASYFTAHYRLAQLDFNSGLGATTPGINQNVYIYDKAEVPAVYGSVELDVLPTVSVALEGRYQWDKSTSKTRTDLSFEQSYKRFLPRVIAQFKPSKALNVYASYSEGVQPPNFNVGYVNATPAQRAYIDAAAPGQSFFSTQPESKNYELGIKQQLLGDRLQYSLAVYQLDWKGQLTTTAVFNPASCLTPPAQSNTAACPLGAGGASLSLPNDARIRGVEFSSLAFISQDWNVGLNLDYKNPKWVSFYDSSQAGFTGGATRFDGNQISRVPLWSGSLNTTVGGALVDAWRWYGRGDLNYTGRAWESNLNLAKMDAYTRVNLRAGVQNKTTTVEAFVTNLFDDKHWDYGYKQADLAFAPLTSFSRQGIIVQAPDRREIGIRTRFAF